MSKYGVTSGPNTGKYGPEITPYSDTFHAVKKKKIFLINRSVLNTFKCSFPIDVAFNMSIRFSERTAQPETIFFGVDFLVVKVYRYFLFVYVQKKLI